MGHCRLRTLHPQWSPNRPLLAQVSSACWRMQHLPMHPWHRLALPLEAQHGSGPRSLEAFGEPPHQLPLFRQAAREARAQVSQQRPPQQDGLARVQLVTATVLASAPNLQTHPELQSSARHRVFHRIWEEIGPLHPCHEVGTHVVQELAPRSETPASIPKPCKGTSTRKTECHQRGLRLAEQEVASSQQPHQWSLAFQS